MAGRKRRIERVDVNDDDDEASDSRWKANGRGAHLNWRGAWVGVLNRLAADPRGRNTASRDK